MMMKIFGAALIVSGGFLLGRVHRSHLRERVEGLNCVLDLITDFNSELRTKRVSLMTYLENHPYPAPQLKNRQSIKGLTEEDHCQLFEWMDRLSTGSYHQSICMTEELLEKLHQKNVEAEKAAISTGKALPMVTGTIALLVAVMLY